MPEHGQVSGPICRQFLRGLMMWNKIKDGDLTALGDLYDAHIDKLYQYGIQLCADHDYVKDCIHDVFVDLYKYRKNLSDTENIVFYLRKSLKNTINRKYKSKILLVDRDDLQPEAPANSIEDEIIHKELAIEKKNRVQNALSFLTEKQRQCIQLRFTEGKSYDEIAELMNVSVETSRTIIYRGMKVLRKHIAFIGIPVANALLLL